MPVRKLIFWTHLTAGVVVGLVILLMSVTGVLLTYEKQMLAWADSGYRVAPQATRLGMETLLERALRPGRPLPERVIVYSDPSKPVALFYGRGPTVYVNPYTAGIAGEGSTAVRGFFQTVTSWHRRFGADGPGRATARAITDACNFAFLFILVSGLYLWIPRRWTRNSLAAVSLFRGGLAGKARDFNWHNVTGIWCVIPLILIVASGVVMSYPWASDLVYRAAGSNPPTRRAENGKAGNRKADNRKTHDVVSTAGWNDAWARAEAQTPDWRIITLRVPASGRAPLTFVIDRGTGLQPQTRGTLVIERTPGAAARWEGFGGRDAGQKLRTWFRFVHTGEYYGVIGQTVAGLASAGAALLVWTGLALAFRRFRQWRARSRTKAQEEEVVLVGAGK